MRSGVHSQIINVHNDVGNFVYNSFHEALEACRAPKEAHWAGNPLKLAHAWYGKCCVWACSGVQYHLPKASSQVNGRENGATRSAYFSNAFTNIFHRIFVSDRSIVKCSKILHQTHVIIFLENIKNPADITTASRLNNS